MARRCVRFASEYIGLSDVNA
ncbi:MAG: hypothetical protein H9806_07145 [Candidatus Lactobacillus pullistercoris]|uniref:Uncharacterized protein n=1 Tax=Candidatus Lactobacillus pullistercoris TaxID=2838636 RepID=A0A9E2KTB1_9LACO|nr:hypothetical protein [Candidatus Lactobacillus pullistercoris]